MKNAKPFFIVILFTLYISKLLIAQTGMPQYNILCEREGTYIGDIKVELFRIITPLHVHNFDSLVSIQFYDTTAFHRVVPGFVIQGGDPNSRHGDPSTWGFGDPSQTTVPAEFTNINHARGIMGAARGADINSATSQFFINVAENSGLNGQYTAYGRVFEGMDVADDIVNSPVVPGTERPQQKIEMFVTQIGVNNSVPDQPVLIFPEDSLADVIFLQNFEWTADSSVVLHRFQLSTDPNFTTLERDTLLGAPNFTVINLEPGFVQYYWRVQANNGGNTSDFSEVRTFTTGIDVPILISPPDSAQNVLTNPTFEWSTVTGAVSYTLQVSAFSSFIILIVNQSEITSTSYQVNGLEENKKLYWRVRGATETYQGMFSEVFSFTTGSATTINEENNLFKYNLEQSYPNPFNPSTKIKYSIQELSIVKLNVYDVLGNEVTTLVNGQKPAGSYEVKWDASGFPSGIYFYKLQAGSISPSSGQNFVETKKMVLMK
jgi:cyclophilin family peptidyl-prolyl cis-trans isomerase